jgi:hypothetical protein
MLSWITGIPDEYTPEEHYHETIQDFPPFIRILAYFFTLGFLHSDTGHPACSHKHFGDYTHY